MRSLRRINTGGAAGNLRGALDVSQLAANDVHHKRNETSLNEPLPTTQREQCSTGLSIMITLTINKFSYHVLQATMLLLCYA